MNTGYLKKMQSKTIYLAFDQDKLEGLIREGKLHAADFVCLDESSKQTVWSLLLATAARTIKL